MHLKSTYRKFEKSIEETARVFAGGLAGAGVSGLVSLEGRSFLVGFGVLFLVIFFFILTIQFTLASDEEDDDKIEGRGSRQNTIRRAS